MDRGVVKKLKMLYETVDIINDNLIIVRDGDVYRIYSTVTNRLMDKKLIDYRVDEFTGNIVATDNDYMQKDPNGAMCLINKYGRILIDANGAWIDNAGRGVYFVDRGNLGKAIVNREGIEIAKISLYPICSSDINGNEIFEKYVGYTTVGIYIIDENECEVTIIRSNEYSDSVATFKVNTLKKCGLGRIVVILNNIAHELKIGKQSEGPELITVDWNNLESDSRLIKFNKFNYKELFK